MGEQSVPNRNTNPSGTSGSNQQYTDSNQDEDMVNGAESNNGNGLIDENMEEEVEEEDISPEEFERLDNQLDALFSALDDIESKNDNIHAQLLQLLQANREIRQQLQQTNESTEQAPPQQ